jgi:predicted DNA-binding transcriptional regulator AlpA
MSELKTFSTSQAAKKLGIGIKTLSRYVAEKKIPAPKIINVGGSIVHIWTEAEIERTRELLPTIANGRKTWRQTRKKQIPKKKIKRKR